nr:receptor-like protein kinase HSL1 [Ipomoea batatas]GME09384.1 receptor-like protein kinase HSL1 [Ipomoea batatas]
MGKMMAQQKTMSMIKKTWFQEILDGLDEDNVIGSGLSRKVYKVVLSSGEVVAVKKIKKNLKLASENSDIEKGGYQDDGFEAEIETLGKIRHKNIVKLFCSSMLLL